MKVLFAVNNENISESIIKKYQQEYKEIISVKNVYYFNAIIKELQRDKTYDRIVISEDLQPFSNNNYDQIDKFIFEKMDSISDEATNLSGNDIPIILICTDRREKSDPLLIKLFGIGVYNALIGKDRSITQVCELLAKPRTKKEAKAYYHVDSEDVDYKVENEGDVSEVEIQNILAHYKKLGGNEQKYVESFEHIASQYTDSQLRLIAKFLPLNVKAVLEANSMKYQEIVSFGGGSSKGTKMPNTNKMATKEPKATKQKAMAPKADANLDLIEKNLSKNRITEPIIVPSAVNTANVKKVAQEPETMRPVAKQQEMPEMIQPVVKPQPALEVKAPVEPKQETIKIEPEQIQEIDDILESLPTSKNETPEVEIKEKVEEPTVETPVVEATQPKRRGRPKKVQTEENATTETAQPKRGRGRPKKVAEEVKPVEQEEPSFETPVNLFEMAEEAEPVTNTAEQSVEEQMVLPGLDDESLFAEEFENNDMPNNNEVVEQNNDFFAENTQTAQNFFEEPAQTETNNLYEEQAQASAANFFAEQTTDQSPFGQNAVQNTNTMPNSELSNLLTGNKKIVAFVGTSKNGTSFLVNNLAEYLSQKGINTAILDLTKNKNAYYIYTENEEPIRQVAYTCIENLRRGNPAGIQVHKNLTVYTTLPGENEDINDYQNILQTLAQNYSLVLLDCDFETNYNYFIEAQELYLVQDYDVLTIQALTAFLRNLKAKNALDPEKVRVVLNKVVKLRSISEKVIIGGMAYYNDPAMSFMTELFNKDTVSYCTIPFEEQTYSKYLEGLINCKITLNGYSKNFILSLEKLANMVYPLINNSNMAKQYNSYNKNSNYTPNNFSNDMNNILDKMKKNY